MHLFEKQNFALIWLFVKIIKLTRWSPILSPSHSYFSFGIISGQVWGSLVVEDHLRSILGIIWSRVHVRLGIICGTESAWVLFAYFDYRSRIISVQDLSIWRISALKWHLVNRPFSPCLFRFFLLCFVYIQFLSGDAGLIRLNGIGYHLEILGSQVDPTKKGLISCPGSIKTMFRLLCIDC